MTGFKLSKMAELYRLLTLSPPKVRLAHADRLEKLLLEFDPDRVYPYEFIYFRVTGFRPKENVLDTFPGREMLPDLHLALERLSGSVRDEVARAEEKVYSAEGLAKAVNVSVRTVHRWRRRGLVARRYVFPDGRKRVGIRQSALDRFVERHAPALDWSRQFTKLTRAEQKDIIALARRYARSERPSRTAAAARIAAELGRAPETVRLVLKRHDHDHPGEAIFKDRPEPVVRESRQAIYADYQQGTPVEVLCERHVRSRSSIYRLINQERAAELLRRPIAYRHEDAFAAEDADADILGGELPLVLDRFGEPAGAGPSGEGAAPWRRSPLSAAEEALLFRAYNYAKFRASQQRENLNPSRYVPSRLIKEIEELRALAGAVKDCLMRVHTPLVEQVARQHAADPGHLSRLIARGRGHLSRLIDSFDYQGRGRFPGHVTLELFKQFARAEEEADAAADSGAS
ncbi:MAG: helix-turn-helix domain-containing protein [Candidatus Brocadiae bacterium]|nr:helix-turn-helix domain-containing protein [Candidatus Brocadiia bacterium]